MKQITKIVIVCTNSLLVTSFTAPGSTIQRLRTMFSRNTEQAQQIVTQEYTLQGQRPLTITNPYGSVSIKKEWSQDKVALSMSTVATAEQIPAATIEEQQAVNGSLMLSVVCPDADKKTIVNLELIVPEKRDLRITTNKGGIYVENIQAGIAATTLSGPIQLTHISGTIMAKTEKKGAIIIDKTHGNIKVTANKGDITILNTTDSVLASTERGSVHLTCQKLPATSKLNIHANSGKIIVDLPQEVNADLMAKTKSGTVVCNHFVTIKPFTTQWNKNAWKHLKHEICGTLGTGEALISIQSDRGNIKIGKYA